MEYKEYICKVADRVINAHDKNWAMNIDAFDWVPGVGLYGIYYAYLYTKETKYLNFLIEWVEKNENNANVLKTVNSTAPLLVVVELYRITGELKYKTLCINAANYILTDAPKTISGGLEHTVTEDVTGFHEQIWADTLFMVCLFMTRAGKIFHCQEYIDFATNQLVIHHKLLKNKNNCLFYHGYDCLHKNNLSGVCWGRANAWITYSTAFILKEIPVFEGRCFIVDSLCKQIQALKKFQKRNGGFTTVLDDKTSYIETSATAGIAAGIYIAKNLNLISFDDTIIAEKALHYVFNQTNKKGEILGVSGGTPIMPSTKDYNKIGFDITLYGQALAVIAAALADKNFINNQED